VVTSRGGHASLTEWLAGVAVGRPAGPAPGSGPEADNIDESGLDVRSYALVRLASLVTAGAPGEGYDRHIAAALDRGVTLDEIIGVLVALLPMVGVARVTEAAPDIFAAISRVAAGLPAAQQSGPRPR
jgi:alkylhydroperoxidase/carboxymuconolactone decarboxylase family protein YurZ